ncbi:MAG TPA: hypothetical protein VEX68_11095 [Bryobacteraceae bacterium]|nr:hypothetical protein [Bryobacteraceae bacterium]
MVSHVRILAILHLVFGALGVLGALFLLALFGGITSLIGMNAPDEEALIAIPIVGGVGAFLVLTTLLLSIPSIIAGIGLLSHRPWSRILTIVLSVLELIHVPFGTALGFYGLWVLLSKEVVPLFERGVTYEYSGPMPRP